MGRGIYCRACQPAIRQQSPTVGGIGRKLAAAKAEKLLALASVHAVANASPELKQDLAVLATVAAQQLAAAWGSRIKGRR